MRESLPALCKMFGEEQCQTMQSKITEQCPEEEQDDEELLEDDEAPAVDLSDEGTHVNLGASLGSGRRGGSLQTVGSFVMTSSNHGVTEEELGEDEEQLDQEW